jgi:hypothetical protein
MNTLPSSVEDEEQNQIDGNKDPQCRGFKRQQSHEIGFSLVTHRIPGVENDQHREKSRQPDEQDADTVDGQVVTDAERRNPCHPLRELHGGRSRLKMKEHVSGEHQLQRSDAKRRVLDQILILEQPEDQGSDQREEQHQR